jgi:16S rRNA processing protein RimM
VAETTPLDDDRGWLIVGRVSKPHGVHGDLLVEIITDFPERLTDGTRFGVGPAEGPETYFEAHRVRYHQGRWLLGVSGLRTREAVEEWRGRYLFLPEQSLDELPEGYYYEHHLVGLECVDADGASLGTVTALDDAGGQTRLVVRRGRREFMVPWVPDLVREVDLDGGRITIQPIPGLLDDDADEV